MDTPQHPPIDFSVQQMQLDLTKCPYLENVGFCCVCDSALPRLPQGTFDDRMFCSGPCSLVPLIPADGNEQVQ